MKKDILIRLAAALVALICVVTMISCGGAEDAETAAPATQTPETAAAPETDATEAEAPKTTDELYAEAVRDAVFADEDEVLPLVNITKDDRNVLWDGERVLVAFLHKYPDSYPAGETINLQWGNVWCVSALEFFNWIKSNSAGVTDWSLRLHQVMGMPEGKATSVTTMWVDADLLYRPACVTDKTAEMTNTLQATGDEEFDTMYKEWYDGNIVWSYFDSAFPWTRLGYTYDWADNGTEYGVSEFLIFSGADAEIDTTLDIDAFAQYALNYGQ